MFVVVGSFLFFVLAASSSLEENEKLSFNQESPLIEQALLKIEKLENQIVLLKEMQERLPQPYPIGMVTIIASNVVDDWFNLNGKGLGEYAGWYICDGRNGTPDLKGKFLVGRNVLNDNSDYSHVGKTGGLEKVTLTEAQMPSHS